MLAQLDDSQSDLDILCFFPDGKDLDPQERECCLHMAFGLVGQHFLRMESKWECSGVECLWYKYTLALTVPGKKVDMCVD